MYLSLFDRVDEYDSACVQAYSSVWIRSCSSVFKVSFYSAAHIAELTSDLVVTATKKLDLNKMVALCALQIAVIEFC